jgi:DNA-directed RNA polymerase specialized sigma24 family protein
MAHSQLEVVLRHVRSLAAAGSIDAQSDGTLLPMVLSVCRRVLHRLQDAEDAFQATFLLLARKAASLTKQEFLAG